MLCVPLPLRLNRNISTSSPAAMARTPSPRPSRNTSPTFRGFARLADALGRRFDCGAISRPGILSRQRTRCLFCTRPDRSTRASLSGPRRVERRGSTNEGDPMPSPIQMKTLLEAGVHFGHQTRRWNPKMKTFIFTERNGIHIIDLQQTVRKLEEAMAYVRDLSSQGGTLLFVGTKKQAQETIEEEAGRCRMPFVSRRWLGGTLTNFQTIATRIQRLEELERQRELGEFERLPKKEASR